MPRPPAPGPCQADHFAKAAVRHFRDAVLLHEAERLANADHHYGFAVECALKSLLIRYLGAQMDGNGPPVTVGPDGGRTKHGHLPGIWTEVLLRLHGRRASALVRVLSDSAPFAGWDVADRYLGDPVVDGSTLEQRKAAARAILIIHDISVTRGDVT